MAIIGTLLTLYVAASVTLSSQPECQSLIQCPCGNTNKNITICAQSDDSNACEKLSRCKKCEDGLNTCLQCEDGYEGHLCSIPTEKEAKSRQKRQYRRYYPVRRPSQGGGNRNPAPGFCSDLQSPKHGSIRCISSDQQRTCTGGCLPGYSFETYDAEEITLACSNGNWEPLTSFPPCKSEGHCDLVVLGSGSFNCTTRMEGTRCDVFCSGRYIGHYFCYPGRPWDPSLPHCVRAKEVLKDRQPCRCQYGGSCDSSGNCVCPAGRTGAICETVIPSKRTCRDPGFISNGFRTKTDGSQSQTRRTFQEGDSVVYGCTSDEFALRGSSLLTCKNDGSWSSPLPKCIKTIVTTEVTCRDPGQVGNADRLNSDGSPSVGIQQYKIGQSVVYTCHEGYALQSRSLITCLSTGSWSNRTPYCSRITTPVPLTRAPTPVTVLKFCKDPGDAPNGIRQPRPTNRRGFPQGSSVEYSCNSGYDLIGEPTLYCKLSGQWSASRPKCELQSPTPDTSEDDGLAYCKNPGSVANGQFVYFPNINNRRGRPPSEDSLLPEYPENSRIDYSCNDGYSLQGTTSLICLKHGFWSSEPPVCVTGGIVASDDESISYCQNPGSITNGRGEYVPSINERRRGPAAVLDDMEEELPQGSRLEYSCDSGYTLEGSDIITCNDRGEWSPGIPACVLANPSNIMYYCSNPGTVMNGRVTYFPAGNSRSSRFPEDQDEFAVDTRLEYSCEHGYMLSGSETLRCLSTSFWSADPPKCEPDCGRSFMKTTMERILHGVKTVNGEWPWVVALAKVENNVSQIVCGGAVLNSRTVLTAAHCLAGARRFTLYFGKLHLRDSNDDAEVLKRRSTRLIIHPDFSDTLDSDIALIQFEPRVQFSPRVQPICLPTAESTAENLMTGRKGYVTGWGLTERNLQSEDLLMASLPFLSNEDCRESYRKQNITLPITRNMFCAGYENGQQSVCEGDSGSPFVYYDGSKERYTVEGIVSFGVQGQCGLPGRYSVFAKVSRFLSWIRRNLQ